jgi:GT2 family glycosyltransferase
MSAPAVSIVVPTCGRQASVRRLLRALAARVGADPIEVIVVGDGIRATECGVGHPQAWPFPVRVIEQARAGAAVARNTGAREARADLLLFLDDDVEPARETIAAHVGFHAALHAAPLSRIGAGGLTPASTHPGYLGSALAGWWEVMCDGLDDPRHRFTFRDLLTGHCSVSRAAFTRLGGFDASLRCHEDFDLGARALAAGIDIRRVTGAEALHHDDSDLGKILRRKFDEGVASVQLARKNPALLPALPLGRPLAQARLARAVQHVALHPTLPGGVVPAALSGAMRAFERLAMRDKWREALERAMDLHYWRGVLTEAGSARAVEALRALPVPSDVAPMEVDLVHGLEELEARIDTVRPSALRVLLDGEPVGHLHDVPGAERLRGVHVRPLLLKTMATGFARAAARSGRLPAVFHLAVGHGPPASAASPAEATGIGA